MKILIVEDEPRMVMEIIDLIDKYNKDIETVACSDPYQAIKVFEEQSFDAALLDIKMPEMTGLELADRLTAMKPEISLAFLTAYNNYAAEAFEVNAVGYVLKPIKQERLYKTLDKMCKEVTEGQTKKLNFSPDVTIRAFGKMVISSGDAAMKWKRRKTSEIFAYLIHQESMPVHKDMLCELIWPGYEPQKALHYLQTIMCELRKNIAEIAGKSIIIEYADQSYRLWLNGADYDINSFINAYKQIISQPSPSVDDLSQTESIYSGHYFEEEGWIWALGRQQSLALKYKKILELLIEQKMTEKNDDETLFYIKKWLANGFYGKQEQYFNWIKKQIGLDEYQKLASNLSLDE